MSKGLPRSLSRGSKERQIVSRMDIAVRDVTVTVSATGTAIGFGSAVIGDFPAAQIKVLGVSANIQLSGSGSDANLTADWEGDFGIGSTPADDATITGTDVNLIASTAIPAATAEVAPAVKAVNGTDVLLDNDNGSLEVNLNVLIDAADITDDASVDLTANGWIEITYITL